MGEAGSGVSAEDEVTLGELARRFDKLELKIDALTASFVLTAVYEADKRTIEAKADSARAIAMWALGVVVSGVAGAIVAAVVSVA